MHAHQALAELGGKKVVILGLGKNKQGSGVGAAKWCIRHGMKVLVTDMLAREVISMTVREVEKEYARCAKKGMKVYAPEFVLGEHREQDILACDIVIQNPDVKFDSPFLMLAAKHGKRIETDLSLFFAFCPYPIIGITGTRGKTTTTMLTGAIFREMDARTVIGGNMRVSPLESLDTILKIASRAKGDEAPPPIVLEISSWQAEALHRAGYSPHIAALTNLSEDHLNRYGTMEKYAAAKEALFAHQRAGDVAVFCREDRWGTDMAKRAHGEVYWTSNKALPRGVEGVYWKGSVASGDCALYMSGQAEPIIRLRDVRLEGKHNLANIAMAVLLAIVYGVEDAVIRKAVRKFTGVPHRQEVVRVWKGITFVNDTTATSPDGVRVALERFGDKRLLWIGGGASKNLSYVGFARELKRKTAYAVMFKGAATEQLLADWPGSAENKPHVVDSMRAAMEHVLGVAKRGDVVLLSPGAASFGVFLNEFDRGEQFIQFVKRLK